MLKIPNIILIRIFSDINVYRHMFNMFNAMNSCTVSDASDKT